MLEEELEHYVLDVLDENTILAGGASGECLDQLMEGNLGL